MLVPAVVGLLTLALSPAEAEVEEVDVLDPAACPAIFGADETHARNHRYRKARLHGLAITDERVEIVHSVGRWQKPTQLRVNGLELIGVEAPDAEPGEVVDPGERVALVEVKESEASLCRPGVYALGPDDSLGRRTRILGVNDRGVLLENAGDLAFLAWEGHRLPKQVRMVWRSSYDVVVDESGGGGSRAASSGDEAARRKAARKKKTTKPARSTRKK